MTEAPDIPNASLLDAHEQDRKRLARELHDDVCQRLFFLAMELTTLALDTDSITSGVSDRLRGLSNDVAVLGQDLYRLAHHLHPATLQHLGLAGAIRAFCRDMSAARKLKIDLQIGEVPEQVAEDIALCVYRIAQEALHNVVRHSGASSAIVTLTTRDDEIVLTVRDGGVGFDARDPDRSPSVGLASMQERARLLNGRFSLWSLPGEGTRIEARIPLDRPLLDSRA